MGSPVPREPASVSGGVQAEGGTAREKALRQKTRGAAAAASSHCLPPQAYETGILLYLPSDTLANNT